MKGVPEAPRDSEAAPHGNALCVEKSCACEVPAIPSCISETMESDGDAWAPFDLTVEGKTFLGASEID